MPGMNADFDLTPDGVVVPSSRGGRREGAGRPKGYSPKRAKDMSREGEVSEGDDQTSLTVRKARAVASKAEADAQQAWLDLRVAQKEYLSRSAFREASATLLAELAQGLRSIPDTLERKYGLPPEQVVYVQNTIDAAMQSVAEGLELFTGSEE